MTDLTFRVAKITTPIAYGHTWMSCKLALFLPKLQLHGQNNILVNFILPGMQQELISAPF